MVLIREELLYKSLPQWQSTFIGRTLNMSVNEGKSKAHNLEESWAMSVISNDVKPTTTQKHHKNQNYEWKDHNMLTEWGKPLRHQ